jgi:hypothetical protein
MLIACFALAYRATSVTRNLTDARARGSIDRGAGGAALPRVI